ncbi:MAG: response regulator [Candidatus Hydrogenedentota bacterium]
MAMSVKPKRKILVVDDDENVRKAICRWFEANGFSVDCANDGGSAVEKCRQGAYDAVTMDYSMPEMDGREAAFAIRQRQPSLPIVILTGYSDTGVEEITSAEISVMYKPVSLRKLEEEIVRLIESCQF